MILEYLKKVSSKENLSENEAYNCMMEMVSGKADKVQMAAFLAALTTKGEAIEEITGFVKAMRKVSIIVSPKLEVPLVDTCGTGGDILKTFNVSTAAAIIAASCGVAIAKHGNRSITSKCGGADILEALGVNINCDAYGVEKCLENTGIGFMFAPHFHPAMQNVMPLRRELGIRTVFNILGPLTSPANADIQLMGVFDPEYVEPMAQVLKNLGLKRAMVVHGFDSANKPAMDEISTLGKTKVALLHGNEVKIQEIHPKDFGLKKTVSEYIKAPRTLDGNLDAILGVLNGKRNNIKYEARLNLCLVNAAAILFITEKAVDFKEGVKIALESIDSGAALNKLNEFVNMSNQMCI